MENSVQNILVVEDEGIIRQVCEIALRRNGFGVISADNGLDGLRLYQQNRKEISLVLSDIAMPVMNGVEMVQKIFALDAEANVIMMSGYSVAHLITDAMKRLCSVIDKPFTATQLCSAVKKCLESNQERSLPLASAAVL